MNAEQRIEEMEKIMAKFLSHKYLYVDNVMKGPKNDLILSNRGIVEFISESAAKHFINAVGKGSKHKLTSGAEITLKNDVTKLNRARNWAITKAEELLKADPLCRGKEIKTNMGNNREVKVDGKAAFIQASSELRGTFLTPFLHLKLP